MDIITLASGSEGNCTLVRTKETTILVDIGISCRRTVNFLKDVGISPQEISAVLITHEHSDHIKGVPLFCKKFGIRAAAMKDIWQRHMYDLPQELKINLTRRMRINDLMIEAFETAHDAVYPVGYAFYNGKDKAAVATDTGYVTEEMEEALEDVNTLVIEANHDQDMLINGSYPYYLKQRILSKRGHLSNNDCGEFLSRKALQGAKIILAHLSEENNTPQIALSTINKKFAKLNKEDFCMFHVAPRLGAASY